MKIKFCLRTVSALLCLCMAVSAMFAAHAAVLPDGYEKTFEENGTTYESLHILEDQYDLIEPVNNRYPIISPDSSRDASYPPLFTGTYEEVEAYLRQEGMTDGMPVVPPTKLKAEKFLGYSAYTYQDTVATVNGRAVKAYQVAANAIMAGCAPEHLPICMAFAEALEDDDYLNSLRAGQCTPMLYVNGPVARQIGVDNAQGMTTEECNIGIGRFMELALRNLAGIERTNAFGNVQPLVFSENDAACLAVGWTPHHVQEGYALNDNVVTATSFSMWGNNVTPATDLPEEIMKVIAWDVTEKNLGALGSASSEANAATHRVIFITESVAAALAAQYKSKDALENALIENARRPLWMRAYAYYYANTGGALTKSFGTVCRELQNTPSEDARKTASPPWLNGITYANIDTVATMVKGNTDILVTGDSSRNKTQVMPGGVSVTREVRLFSKWDTLVTGMNYNPIASFYLASQEHTISPPESIPSALTDGTYRILEPTNGTDYLTRPGRVYYDTETQTLYYYAQGASASDALVLDAAADSAFIQYITTLGANSSFTVQNGNWTAVTMRFSSNSKKLHVNASALTSDSFEDMSLTLHANNTAGSNAAGGLAKDGAAITLSDTVTTFAVSLDGTLTAGDGTENGFVTLRGDTVTVDPSAKAGAAAVIGAANDNGTYRTLTFVNGGDGTYTVTFKTAGTLSLSTSTYALIGSFNDWTDADVFSKTGNADVLTLTRELPAGTYTFKIRNIGTDDRYGKDDTSIDNTVNRLTLSKTGEDCTLNAVGGVYEFKYEISTNKLSVYYDANRRIPGDANEDRSVDLKDAAVITRWLAGGWNVTINEGNADVNADGVADLKDAVLIRRFLAGGWNVELK